MWEAQLNTNALLAKITPAHIEDGFRRQMKIGHLRFDGPGGTDRR
jgi:hypothetical protein